MSVLEEKVRERDDGGDRRRMAWTAASSCCWRAGSHARLLIFHCRESTWRATSCDSTWRPLQHFTHPLTLAIALLAVCGHAAPLQVREAAKLAKKKPGQPKPNVEDEIKLLEIPPLPEEKKLWELGLENDAIVFFVYRTHPSQLHDDGR